MASMQGKLAHPLTAVNLKRYPRIEILWTPYIYDHLRFSVSYKKLQVFGEKQWLQDAKGFLERRGKQRRRESDADQWIDLESNHELPPYPVPAAVLEEAILSLDYLFPNDQQTEVFLDKHGKVLPLPDSERPRLKQFTYYHDRLIEVAQEFLSPPRD
ncbi:hypothetical protein F4802DRAFT_603029 [Xylaria palmicola]|nr:hypothetical protein F4802DRAFT_603029 [Xylaria palmicola]